jgi:hypothetical protein
MLDTLSLVIITRLSHDWVAGVDERVASVNERVAGVDEGVAGVDERVARVDEGVVGVDECVAGRNSIAQCKYNQACGKKVT